MNFIQYSCVIVGDNDYVVVLIVVYVQKFVEETHNFYFVNSHLEIIWKFQFDSRI